MGTAAAHGTGVGLMLAPRPRDTQRGRVYQWEKMALYHQQAERVPPAGDHSVSFMGLAECQHLVNRVWKLQAGTYTKPPRVTDGRGQRRGGYRQREHTIMLPTFCRFKELVLHELAHGLLGLHMRLALTASHGPEWVAVYIDLLARYAGHQRGELRRTAQLFRVKVGRLQLQGGD